MKDKLSSIGCLLVLLMIVSGAVYMCEREKKRNEQKRQRYEFVADSIAKRKQYVSDSIDSVKKTPEYIAHMDSADRELHKMMDEIDQRIIVLVLHGDSHYHYMTQCFDVADIGKIRPMSRFNAEKLGYFACDVCHYNDDEYIQIDDVPEYMLFNFDKDEIIDMFDISKYDFEE